jgi:5-methylcytosine-specific restriction endonuclease McrA
MMRLRSVQGSRCRASRCHSRAACLRSGPRAGDRAVPGREPRRRHQFAAAQGLPGLHVPPGPGVRVLPREPRRRPVPGQPRVPVPLPGRVLHPPGRSLPLVRRAATRHLGMATERGVQRADVAIDHIIPMTRGGPVHAEWNKQLLHKSCNASTGNQVPAAALALAAEHGRGAGLLGGLPPPGADAPRCGSAPDDAIALGRNSRRLPLSARPDRSPLPRAVRPQLRRGLVPDARQSSSRDLPAVPGAPRAARARNRPGLPW